MRKVSKMSSKYVDNNDVLDEIKSVSWGNGGDNNIQVNSPSALKKALQDRYLAFIQTRFGDFHLIDCLARDNVKYSWHQDKKEPFECLINDETSITSAKLGILAECDWADRMIKINSDDESKDVYADYIVKLLNKYQELIGYEADIQKALNERRNELRKR